MRCVHSTTQRAWIFNRDRQWRNGHRIVWRNGGAHTIPSKRLWFDSRPFSMCVIWRACVINSTWTMFHCFPVDYSKRNANTHSGRGSLSPQELSLCFCHSFWTLQFPFSQLQHFLCCLCSDRMHFSSFATKKQKGIAFYHFRTILIRFSRNFRWIHVHFPSYHWRK